jgi:DHA1 family bicyclomycin/chloramphenicol resistance-like MFS transporter
VKRCRLSAVSRSICARRWATLPLFRHKRVLSYMLASGFSFAGMFSFLSAGPFVYIEINHVSPQDFGYYFALNIVFLFLMTIINSRFVRRVGR